MTTKSFVNNKIEFYSLTIERWADFTSLMGVHGGDEGCWCMWWRLPEDRFEQQKGEANKNAMHDLIIAGEIPGIIAYVDGQVAAWCSCGPRKNYPALHRYWQLNQAEDDKIWSIVCYYVDKEYRRLGLMDGLINVAIELAKENGAEIIEGYPIKPSAELTGYDGFTGIASTYQRCGFVEKQRNDRKEVLMQYEIKKGTKLETIKE